MMNQLIDLITLLSRHDVEFVVVGGYAVAAYGSLLVTQDLDICCEFDEENLLKLQKALAGTHPVHRMTTNRVPLVLTPENCAKLKNIYLDTDIGSLDCLGSVLGVGDYDAVKARSIEIYLEGSPCRIIELNALIEAKQAMGREKDLVAIRDLKAIRERMNKDGSDGRN